MMEAVVNHSFVIWKQPNKKDCFFLKHQQNGKENFVIKAFDSNESPIQLTGEINAINPLEIEQVGGIKIVYIIAGTACGGVASWCFVH